MRNIPLLTDSKCSICGNSAETYRPHSGQFMCNDCFIKSIEKIINRTISKYNMLNPDDLIVVGLSGGKDSLALLYNLLIIQQDTFNSKKPIALSINEGIKGYREESIKFAAKFCKNHNIEHHIISFKDEFGYSLNEIVSQMTNSNDLLYACNYCATIRRRILNDQAKKLGASKLALGHNLTDFAETFLMNIMYKRIKLIGNQYPKKMEPKNLRTYYIKKIFPLMRIPEDEIQLYMNLKKIKCYPIHCSYRDKDPILRKRVLRFIQDTKKISPEIEFNLFSSFLELSELLYHNKTHNSFGSCQKCGYPSGSKKFCRYCALKISIEKMN